MAISITGEHPDCPRIGVAQLRREKGFRRKDVEALAKWNAKSPANEEIPFVVAHCFAGLHRSSLIVDLAAMRSAMQRARKRPDRACRSIWWITLCRSTHRRASELNLDMEFKRNRERYQFLKWGQQAFKTFQLIPPGIGIVHQVNLEYLAKSRVGPDMASEVQEARSFFPTLWLAPIRTRP